MCMQSKSSSTSPNTSKGQKTLPSSTLNAIKLLNSQFQEQREYGNTSGKNHNKNDFNRNYRRRNHNDKRNVSSSSPTNNKSSEQFQATVFKSKEGVEKHMSELFTALNKVTDVTYEALKNDIFRGVRIVIEEYSETEINRLLNTTFNVATNHRFHSQVYAKIYKELIDKYDIFKTRLIEGIREYDNYVTKIDYVDANENYEEFCKINQTNEKRKSFTVFIVNLMKEGVISFETMEEYLNKIVLSLKTYINEEGQTKSVEEITENIFLFLSNIKGELEEHNKYDLWKGFVTEYSKKKISECKSYSNRCKFKYMDILDIYSGKKKI